MASAFNASRSMPPAFNFKICYLNIFHYVLCVICYLFLDL